MRMYILVRDKAPKGHGVNAVAHASLMCYLEYQKDPDVIQWLAHSFRKITCIVTDEELNLAKKSGHYIEFRENTLDNMLLAVAFKPRKDFPCYFNGFKLYS